MRLNLCAAVLPLAVALAGSSMAAEIRIDVPDSDEVQTSKLAYMCGEKPVSADYINAGSVALAVLTLDGETVVASNVIAGSGAKYAGGQYVWWTKGEEATLYDVREGDDAKGIACKPA